MLRESICTSDTLAQLAAEEERHFYRVLVQADDHGRFDARQAVIRAHCYAAMLNQVSARKSEAMTQALARVGLITLYEVDGRRYGWFVTWEKHQFRGVGRPTKSLFPAPPTTVTEPEQTKPLEEPSAPAPDPEPPVDAPERDITSITPISGNFREFPVISGNLHSRAHEAEAELKAKAKAKAEVAETCPTPGGARTRAREDEGTATTEDHHEISPQIRGTGSADTQAAQGESAWTNVPPAAPKVVAPSLFVTALANAYQANIGPVPPVLLAEMRRLDQDHHPPPEYAALAVGEAVRHGAANMAYVRAVIQTACAAGKPPGQNGKQKRNGEVPRGLELSDPDRYRRMAAEYGREAGGAGGERRVP